MRIRDVALKTCQRRWTIGRSSERGSGISLLVARYWWWWVVIVSLPARCLFGIFTTARVYSTAFHTSHGEAYNFLRCLDIFITLLVGQPLFPCWGVWPTTKNGGLGYVTKQHLMIRIRFWRSGECGEPFHCYFCQVHPDLKKWYLSVPSLGVKLKIIPIQ